MFVCRSIVYLSVCLSVCRSIVHLSVCLSVCHFIHHSLSFYLSFSVSNTRDRANAAVNHHNLKAVRYQTLYWPGQYVRLSAKKQTLQTAGVLCAATDELLITVRIKVSKVESIFQKKLVSSCHTSLWASESKTAALMVSDVCCCHLQIWCWNAQMLEHM